MIKILDLRRKPPVRLDEIQGGHYFELQGEFYQSTALWSDLDSKSGRVKVIQVNGGVLRDYSGNLEVVPIEVEVHITS